MLTAKRICYYSSVPTRVIVVRERAAGYRRSAAQIPLKLVTPTRGLAARPEGVLRTVGLFAGIGGFELGLQRAGHAAQHLCEIEPGARAVLDKHFATVERSADITKLDSLPPSTDLVVGGFPCQDLSQAGKTAGLAGKNSGLVSHVFRLIERTKPRWLILENVAFMLSLARGQALAAIVQELRRLGYVWAYRVVNTRSFGLPQRRERVFIVAARDADPRTVLFADESGEPEPRAADAFGFYWTEGIRGLGWAEDAVPTLKGGSTIGIASPPAIWFPGGEPSIVKPDIRDAERMQGFDADWTRPAEEVTRKGHRWKLVGNAVTVDVAEWLGRRLIRPGEYDDGADGRLPDGARWPRAAYDIGEGIHVADRSAFPLDVEQPRLRDFLRFPCEPLSLRGISGFLDRVAVSSLRFKPEFLRALRAHKKFAERAAATA